MTKIEEYGANVQPNDNDILIINDAVTGETKKITRYGLLKGTPLPAGTVDEQSLATATKAKLAQPMVTANSGYSFKIGEMLINCGYTNVANAGTAITFATPFSALYSIVCTTTDTNLQAPWVTARSNTGATLKQSYTGGALAVNWIAIGKA